MSSALLRKNPTGAKTQAWLREISVTLNSRLSELSERDLASLSTLAASPVDREVWRACLHWYWARVDYLYYEFVTGWLYRAYLDGVYRLTTDHVLPFVVETYAARSGQSLSEYGQRRAAHDLLRMASDFGLLTESNPREFNSYHLPDEAFLYLLHAMADLNANGQRIIESRDWHMFLMSADDVERELLRLHQFRTQLRVAGTFGQLTLPRQHSPTRRPATMGTTLPERSRRTWSRSCPPGSAPQVSALPLDAVRDLPMTRPRSSPSARGRDAPDAARTAGKRVTRSPSLSAWT